MLTVEYKLIMIHSSTRCTMFFLFAICSVGTWWLNWDSSTDYFTSIFLPLTIYTPCEGLSTGVPMRL